ncbi:Uu.00g049220.m01.CDS01 [Anthostomella pinea]|uniref:Uu.00g049220.m01.CDS01 n=1 Tax=Anthostomella pinea TaxID=933095 RepID=A0AAI8VBW0_9PEZI|nr:Uu.00g049220.m01.CDS01 [Anthostomella pinea]
MSYRYLKRDASRWQNLPVDAASEPNFDNTQFNLLLYIKGLKPSPEGVVWDGLIRAINDLPPAHRTRNLHALREGLLASASNVTGIIGRDYKYDQEVDLATSVNLRGNNHAAEHMQEMGQLIKLARTAFPDPNDLDENPVELFTSNLRAGSAGLSEISYTHLFTWARCWAEVRYRFLNHCLRDDPLEHASMRPKDINDKGNDANALVHESRIEDDCWLVQFNKQGGIGFSNPDRTFFKKLYLLEPEEAQHLSDMAKQNSGYRTGLQPVFNWSIQFINEYFKWRTKLLEAVRKHIFNQPAVRGAWAVPNKDAATSNQWRLFMTSGFDPVHRAYKTGFLPALKQLMADADSEDAFYETSYDACMNAATALINEVRNTPANTYATPALGALDVDGAATYYRYEATGIAVAEPASISGAQNYLADERRTDWGVGVCVYLHAM